MSKDSLTITDQRNGKTYEAPIELGTIRAMDLRKIKTSPDDFGVMTYDPAFMNTASCKSSITFIDGDKGILRYRGYDIETLAEHCNYLQVAYLLLYGELPTPQQDKDWTWEITHHTMLHETTKHVHRRLPLRRPSHGHPGEHAGGAVDGLSRGQGHSRSGEPAEADRAADRQDGDAGGVFLSSPPRPSLRLSRQRSQLHRKLHEHAVEDDRTEVYGESGHRARARRALHSARRPRAELQLDHDARHRQRADRSLSLDGGSGGGAGRPAARRRERRSAEDAGRDRLGEEHSRITSSG